MKKSLIALAVLAAAGAASAQSSVTLFGVVDATLAVGKGRGAGSSDRTQLTHSGYNSSRLGFRGTEDLGGGMSASFWLEAGMSNDTGEGFGTNTNNQASGAGTAAAFTAGGGAGRQGLTFNRRSTVSLAGGWGEIRLGRDYSPQFWNLTVFDPFGTNGVGHTVTNTNIITGVTSTRASNSIGYFLPGNLGGFYGQGQVYLGENAELNTGSLATERDGRGGAARVGYAAGPINVAGAVSRTKYAAGNVRQNNLGAQYDFGVAKLMGHISRDRNGTVDARGALIGGLFPIGAGEIRTSYAVYKIESPIAGGTDAKAKKLALGYVHNLSKRTALYTTFARVKNSGGSATALNGAVTAANSSSTGYDFGVRHSF